MRVLAKLSYERIAAKLNTDLRKYPPPRPNRAATAKHRWTRSAVRSILENPKYTGYQVWNRKARKKRGNRANPVSEWVWSPRPTHEPLITPQLFDAAWPSTSAHPEIRKECGARAAAASADRFYVLRSYLFSALCNHRMYGKDSKGRSYYACQPKKDQHQDAAWYASHPKAVWISERIMLEAIHTFFEDRLFGPQRRELLAAAMAAAPEATSPDRSADIQRLQNESDRLAHRKELLLDQLASPDADGGDPETAAEFRKGIRKRFDALEHKRREVLAQLKQYREEAASSDGPGDVELIEAIPQLSFRFAQLPDALKREIFDAFQLRVRYDGRDHGVQLQATILGAVAPDLAQIGERAAAVARAVGQPIRERPRREPQSRAGRAAPPVTCGDAVAVTASTHLPKTRAG
ncbi:recombinase family protein [Streptomyces sp. DG2A-72]|uniref:recombinase family protein n=1 Tax=Streptomyces sp. DG2A-72 TaxID=3051386 RepID=UPI00265B9595|nr:recombinase family protein [Streptomyces sp. DG2A-72]MDO0930215.1 recombinase family protein [Streptomyces sp. DG2A-72]